MMLAASIGNINEVKKLIESGHDVNQSDILDWTPLHSAVSYGHKELVEILLAAGADFKKTTLAGRYPIHIAAEHGRNEIVKILIAAGASFKCNNWKYKTPGHCAAENGHNEVVKILIDAGADLSELDGICMTPIYYAVVNGHKEVVKTLLGKIDYSTTKIRYYGATLLMHAMAWKHNEIIELLRWPDAHPYLLDICIAFASIELPPYVLMEIFDWLPLANDFSHNDRNKSQMHLVSPYKKIRLIQGFMDSRKAVMARRLLKN